MDSLTPNAASKINDVFAAQHRTALALRTSTAEQRISRLRKLEAAVLAHQGAIHAALMADLHKAEAEADLSEIMPVIAEIRHAARHLRGWMRTRRASVTLAMLGTQARIRHEPRGVTLIISPWNYPIGLTLGPLVSAIAAGNTAMIKPSELSPNCSAVLGRIIAEVFDPTEVALFEGDAALSTALLELPFDHIFFTGSPAVGKIVMAAAARHLSSVTLELGGKSPTIVDASADIAKAARNIMWGKFLNNGQTCIAPDYLFVHENVLPEFLAASKDAITKMFGANVQASPDYGRIINGKHFQRVKRLLDDATANGARVVAGGTVNEAEKFLAPTLLTDVGADSSVLQDEIFGPILPIISYQTLDKVIEHVNDHPKPLALYIYAKSEENIARVLAETSSGGAAINMSLLQFTHSNLPYGGVNNSGIGSSHGVFGFRAFSHERAVLRDQMSAIHMLFPPYTKRVSRTIKLMMKYFT
jgi:aldehyde dehydrogenase (NAD+)